MYIDFYNDFNDKLMGISAQKLYVDGLHPTELGHEIMAQCITDEIYKRAKEF